MGIHQPQARTNDWGMGRDGGTGCQFQDVIARCLWPSDGRFPDAANRVWGSFRSTGRGATDLVDPRSTTPNTALPDAAEPKIRALSVAGVSTVRSASTTAVNSVSALAREDLRRNTH